MTLKSYLSSDLLIPTNFRGSFRIYDAEASMEPRGT